MKTTLAILTLVFASVAFAADIKLTKLEKTVNVEIDGKLFTTYYFADGRGGPFVRPFMFPVNAPDGFGLTADQYGQKEHPHHRSFWIAHGDVSGADHWSLNAKPAPKQNNKELSVDGETIKQQLEWEAKDAQTPILKEARTVKFFVFPDDSRGVDITSVFTALKDDVVFNDTKESGLCSVRFIKALSVDANLLNSTGARGMKATWGKPANWVDTSGPVDGKTYGISIFDHPQNPRHPSTWHIRDYGLMTSNIFGLSEFDKTLPKGSGKMEFPKDKPITFKYRVVIHMGDAEAAKIAAKYKDFAK